MKKLIFTLLFLSSLVFGLQAQVLATFENVDEDVLYLSDYGTSGDPFWYENSRFVAGGLPQIGANPSKTGVNTSDKCLFAINVADASWWGNFAVLGLKEPIVITEANRYLHFKVYRSIQPKNFRIGFNGREDAHSVFQGKASEDGKWVNIVSDLGAKFMGQELKYIHIILSNNWDEVQVGWGVATYAYDDFGLSDTSLPPGANLLDGHQLHIGFEDQAETDQWVNEIDMINEGNSYEIIDNPFAATSINTTGKVLKFNKGATASWWQGCRFDFKGIMGVSGQANPKYLHTAVYIPSSVLSADMMNLDVQLCAKDHMGNEITQMFTVWDDEMDEWIDLVMEVATIDYLKELTVRYDLRKNENGSWINTPANTYYLDDIVFNNDENPRREIKTGIRQADTSFLAKIGTSNGMIRVRTNDNAQIRIYNILGGLIQSAQGRSDAAFTVGKGVFIVKVTDGNNEQVTKVTVN